MKRMSERLFAVLILVLCCLLIFPVSAYATDTEVPKGYVDPVKELGMRAGYDADIWELYETLDEIYLVPYEPMETSFDISLNR